MRFKGGALDLAFLSINNLRQVSDFKTYAVSDEGSVWSWRSGRWHLLKPVLGKNGYLQVALHEERRQSRRSVHSLVLRAFHGPREGRMVCRHLNGNPLDNRSCNLAWGTCSENAYDTVRHGRHPRRSVQKKLENGNNAKLTNDNVREIRSLLAQGVCCRIIGERFGVSSSCIFNIKYGNSWSSLT